MPKSICVSTDLDLIESYRATPILFGTQPRDTDHPDDWGDQRTVSLCLRQRGDAPNRGVFAGLSILGPRPGYVVLVRNQDFLDRHAAGLTTESTRPYDMALIYQTEDDMHEDWILEE